MIPILFLAAALPGMGPRCVTASVKLSGNQAIVDAANGCGKTLSLVQISLKEFDKQGYRFNSGETLTIPYFLSGEKSRKSMPVPDGTVSVGIRDVWVSE